MQRKNGRGKDGANAMLLHGSPDTGGVRWQSGYSIAYCVSG
jgi:hypothetical protein